MQLFNTTLGIALTVIVCLPTAADTKVVAGDPNTSSRTVACHDTDIVPIAAEIRFTTLIELQFSHDQNFAALQRQLFQRLTNDTNVSKDRHALSDASWITFSASCSFRVSQRARL
jgi:hypothetical protein